MAAPNRPRIELFLSHPSARLATVLDADLGQRVDACTERGLGYGVDVDSKGERSVSGGNRGSVRERLGFRDGDRGSHTSRTMMLGELSVLLDHVPVTASRADYLAAIEEANLLGKKTARTRELTAKHLRELYGLKPELAVFRALRSFWIRDPGEGRPLLALLCAVARDPLLRSSADVILSAPTGAGIEKGAFEKAFLGQAPDRFAATTLGSLARNIASTWTQSGHLAGHQHKIRSRPAASPAAAAYAATLAFLEGARGQILFQSPYVRLLDRPVNEVHDLLVTASRRGWIDYRSVGAVVDVRLSDLLSEEEQEWLREQA